MTRRECIVELAVSIGIIGIPISWENTEEKEKRLYIYSRGNVGFGCLCPNATLHIVGNNASDLNN